MAQNLSVRDAWAQFNAVEAVRRTYNKYSQEPGIPILDGLPRKIEQGKKFPRAPTINLPPRKVTDAPRPKVAIIGAGAAGLFTALLFDYLNANVSTFHVDYDLFESSSRVGGRLFTYTFDKSGPHDYYDVGAMRFPQNPIMERTFQLFQYLGMTVPSDPTASNPPVGSLIPYYIKGNNEPWCFNDRSFVGSYSSICVTAKTDDPFGMSFDPINPISHDALKIAALPNGSPEDVLTAAIEPWVLALKQDAEHGGDSGWKLLMQIDGMSTTEFLTTPPALPGTNTAPVGYNYNTIEWLETFGGGTSWYDQAHSETVLEYLDFNYPVTPPQSVNWYCIEGGAQVLAAKMLEKLANPEAIKYNTPITGIDLSNSTIEQVQAQIQYNGSWQGSYAGVFNSTTMGVLQQMDLRNAGLNYGKKQAIRSLGYGASAKVGMMFSEPWWRTMFNINHGGLGHSDLPVRTVVYPSYNVNDDPKKPAALLCSYTWQQDAQRISTLISSSSDPATAKQNEAALKKLVLWDLARLHANESITADALYEKIERMCTDMYAHDWYHDPNTFGAFAFFRPLQFSSMWPYIITPSPGLVMIGEHASNHHAWVVGALEGAVFGVYHWLKQNPTMAGAQDAVAAMKKWTQLTGDNPFGVVPPWLPDNESDWQVFFSRHEHEQFLSEVQKEKSAKVGT